jgi:Putative zinc-finger
MRMECHEAERLIDRYVENELSESELSKMRAHLNTCEACALLSLELEFTLSLCRTYPQLEPPPRLISRILQQTSGEYRSLSWREYLRELFRPLYTSPRFATGACLAAISFSIVLNALGVNFGEIRWSDLTPRKMAASLNRTVNIAYDNGLRRLNDLKILYQIQSKIDELRTEETDQEKRPEPEPNSKQRPQQNSAAEYLMAFRSLTGRQPAL